MTAFQVALDVEVDELRGTRVHALPSTVAERATALRYRLDRVDENLCDGYATEASPDPLVAGQPVETKSVRLQHHDGTGRLSVHPDSHRDLAAAGGLYAVVLYAEVDVDDRRRILALAVELVDPEDVDEWLPPNPRGYQKVRWDQLLDVDVDVARWSA